MANWRFYKRTIRKYTNLAIFYLRNGQEYPKASGRKGGNKKNNYYAGGDYYNNRVAGVLFRLASRLRKRARPGVDGMYRGK